MFPEVEEYGPNGPIKQIKHIILDETRIKSPKRRAFKQTLWR
jgi:hypothetical protein